MMFKSTHVKALVDIYSNKCILKGNITQKSFRSFLIRNLYDTSTSSETISFENQLKGVFKFKNSNICNWIVENKARILCSTYQESSKNDKEQILRILAFKYAVQHPVIFNIAEKFVSTEPNNERRIVSYERNLKNALTPDYQWLFITIGRLQNGVKFLVDLRTDILISDYEAIHPIRNWLDLKQRVGPYRRCYIFTHPSMPREPLVVLHTALCDIIPDSLRGIEEAKVRILDNPKTEVTFLEEDKCKIKTAIFYSITSTQKGLQGIELGNYLIKEVAKQVLSEFPMITELSTLSPIPNFRTWFLEKTKQDIHNVFTNEEYESVQKVLNNENIVLGLKKIFNNSLWTRDIAICEILRKPLLRACAWYLYKEKRRNYALNNVANFHLRNGAVMWRINWLADPSPRGVGNSCGIMVNYRYYLDECEKNSQNYIENYFINTSEDVINLANQFEKL
ncbi:malonyl-CoA decarboxylase, mitochondrial isoform X2 [Bombus vancouverensis nearcticus]|uniref:Malonyl-CoA decarboxylase, mitochondrial-like isoform X2 n=1 Tax=Bombus bifarius TaxID=103933 RepID=A0A6P8NLJ8_9HYME|nr:malonyl-CoA decarboxylase, mitochondrial-like isoform X2 [Bombus vancouverensis nearcticus]XP_033315267.1 malonyl-CoA decarboxylase, mitochondrial-like isoform X2 [Bombus bifarius]